MSEFRKIAAEIVHNAMFGDIDAEPAIDNVLRRLRPSHAQSELFRRLATGPILHAGTLDAIISAYSHAALSEIEPRVLSSLRVGAYEIVFMEEKAPRLLIGASAHAARRSGPRAYSLVKDILHAIYSGTGDAVGRGPKKNPRSVLQVSKSKWRRFDRPVFPNPDRHRAEFLAAVWSLPAWLAQKLLDQFGRDAQKVMAGCMGHAPPAFVPNLRKNDLAGLARKLSDQGLTVEYGAGKRALVTRETADINSLPAYLNGRMIVTDEFDIAAVNYLNPRPGERICILQGKIRTMTQIAQLVLPGGQVTGCVRSWQEAQSVLAEKKRFGLDNLHVVVLDVNEGPSVLGMSFDRVFVEPANTGVGKLRRRAAARWRLSPESSSGLVADQKLALQAAIELCAAGGIAVYSTAALFREENEDVVQAVTGPMQHMKVIETRTRIPVPDGCDGGFMAKMAKLNAP